MLTTLDAIATRRSSARLVEPGPSPADLRRILDAAGQAPDHGNCRPWSFIVIPRASTPAFGAVLAAAYVRRCQDSGVPVDPDRHARERDRATRVPVYLVAACRPRLDVPIPAHEQVAAVAAATQNLLIAATALGYGSKWVTGAAATDPMVKRALDLDEHDSIVGFVHLGTAPHGDRTRPRRTGEPNASVRFWFESIPLS